MIAKPNHINKSNKMDRDWKQDVAAFQSRLNEMKDILEMCQRGNSAQECILLNPDLSDRLVGKVVTDLIDGTVPVCVQLQKAFVRARAAKAPKDEKKSAMEDHVEKVKIQPSVKEVVPVPKEQVKSFEDVTERNEKEGTSLKEAMSNIMEFIRSSNEEVTSSQVAVHRLAASKKSDQTETKKVEKTDVLDGTEANGGNSSSLEAKDVPMPAVLESTHIPIEEEKKKPLNNVETDSFLQRFIKCRVSHPPKATPIAHQRSPAPKGKEEKEPFVPACVEVERTGVLRKIEVIDPKKEEKSLGVDEVKESKKSKIIPKKEQTEVEEMLIIPSEKIGFVAGKQFANVNRLREAYGVKVSLPAKGGNEVVIKGTAEDVATAKKDIQESLPVTLTYQTEDYYIGFIVGHKGVVIRGLRKEYGVTVEINQEQKQVIIDGNKERCGEALLAIESIVAKRKKIDASRVRK